MWEEERSLGQKKRWLRRVCSQELGPTSSAGSTHQPSSGQPLTPSLLKFSLLSPENGTDLPNPESRSRHPCEYILIILRRGRLISILSVRFIRDALNSCVVQLRLIPIPQSVSHQDPRCLTACETSIGLVLPAVVAHASLCCSHHHVSVRMCGSVLLPSFRYCGMIEMLVNGFSWFDTLGMHGACRLMQVHASRCRICTIPHDTRPSGGMSMLQCPSLSHAHHSSAYTSRSGRMQLLVNSPARPTEFINRSQLLSIIQ